MNIYPAPPKTPQEVIEPYLWCFVTERYHPVLLPRAFLLEMVGKLPELPYEDITTVAGVIIRIRLAYQAGTRVAADILLGGAAYDLHTTLMRRKGRDCGKEIEAWIAHVISKISSVGDYWEKPRQVTVVQDNSGRIH